MPQQTLGKEIEQESWHWHHKLAGAIGITSLAGGVVELALGQADAIPMLLVGSMAVGHVIGGSKFAGYVAREDL